jgi:WD40 repeat protein
VAASQGTIWLFRYTAGSYEGNSVMDIKAVPVPGYPVKVTKMNNSYEDPGLVARDNLGNLWIAGTIDGTAALWKLDENGSLLPGFPLRSRGGLGAGLALNAIAVDPEGNCYATGASGNDLAVLGFDAQGTPLAGLPYYVSGAPGRLEGRGIDIAPGGSLWVAATAVSASASISFIRLYLLSFTTDPLPVAPGDVRVRGPGGGVLNILKGERVEILANPCEAGILRVQVLTPRGEAVRELTAYVSAGQFPGIAWDGRNTAGEKVADGVYMVRVTGGGLKAVRRVVVIRRK